MSRFLCYACSEVVEAVPARFAFCSGCGAPLTTEDIVLVQPTGKLPGQTGTEPSATPPGA
jgi:hypothetical protein